MKNNNTKVELTSDQFLDMVANKVKEDYGISPENAYLEMDNETKIISAVFTFKDKIGVLKVETDIKAE